MWSTGQVKALRPLPEFLEPLGVLPAPAAQRVWVAQLLAA